MFTSVSSLIAQTGQRQCRICDLMVEYEMDTAGLTREQVYTRMDQHLQVMEAAVVRGTAGVQSHSGLTGGDAARLAAYRKSGRGLTDGVFLDALTFAIATNEVNAAMGIICASPTAGSAGVLPGVLLAVREKLHPDRTAMLNYLFTAGAFGLIIANNASVAGATGGCQAEIGSASGMAAAALTEMAGGTPHQAAQALAIALKNLLGLVCDPVAGLVEIPCIKRNAAGAAIALGAAEMALAGIESHIPCDQVISAMKQIGQAMPEALRETARGGLAATAEGLAIRQRLYGK